MGKGTIFLIGVASAGFLAAMAMFYNELHRECPAVPCSTHDDCAPGCICGADSVCKNRFDINQPGHPTETTSHGKVIIHVA